MPPQVQNTSPSASHLTLEIVLWTTVVAFAFLLRMTELDKAPLSSREAETAMLAWQGAAGEALPVGHHSPLLLAATAGLFAVAGSSDALARLWPALAGTILVITPVLLRRHLGALGTLAAGLCLATSPTAIVASRQLDPMVFAALGVAVCLGGVLHFLHSKNRRWLLLAVEALALVLAAGGPAFGLLFPLLIAGGVVLSSRWAHLEYGLIWTVLHEHRSEALVVFAVSLVILTTGFGWHPQGLAALGDSSLAWLAGPGSPQQGLSPVSLLAFYEPLVLVWGVLGLTHLLQERRALGALLGGWAVVALLLLMALPGRMPLDTLAVVLPGALLAGVGIGRRVTDLQQKAAWRSIRPYVPVVVVLWAYVGLMLGRYGAQGQDSDLLLAMLAFMMQALLLALFALLANADLALNALGIGSGLVLLVYTLSVGWGAGHVRSADPREPMIDRPTSEEVRELIHTLQELSWHETGMPTTLAFATDTRSDPVLAWYLREFTEAQPVSVTEVIGTPLSVLVTLGRDLEVSGTRYVGQDFALRRVWESGSLNCTWTWPVHCSDGIRWWLLRQTPAAPAVGDWATIWVEEMDEALAEP